MRDAMGMKRLGFRKRCYRGNVEPTWKGLVCLLVHKLLGGAVLMH